MYKDMRVLMDGREVGTIAGKAALDAGQTFDLGADGTLSVQFDKTFGSQGLKVSRNGVPLPGSIDDPGTKVKTATGLIYLVAGFNAVLGLVGALGNIDLLKTLGIGWTYVVIGACAAALGFAVSRRQTWALVLFIVLFVIDGVLSLANLAGGQGTTGIVVRVFLLIPMIRAVPAMGQMKKAARGAVVG
jgi:hypothetical protein